MTIDTFELSSKLSSNNYGYTMLGTSKSTNMKVVAKFINKNVVGEENFFKMFNYLEKFTVNDVKGVVKYHQISFEDGKNLILIRKWIDGISITDYILKNDKLNKFDSYSLWVKIVRVVFFLHKCGIHPNNIKPSNIFLTHDNEIFITDLYSQPCESFCNFKIPDSLDLGLKPPEFFTRNFEMTDKSDVWTLGVLLIFLSSRQMLWNTKNIPSMIKSIDSCVIKLQILYQITPSFRDILSKIIVHDPDNRISSDELIKLLLDKHSKHERKKSTKREKGDRGLTKLSKDVTYSHARISSADLVLSKIIGSNYVYGGEKLSHNANAPVLRSFPSVSDIFKPPSFRLRRKTCGLSGRT